MERRYYSQIDVNSYPRVLVSLSILVPAVVTSNVVLEILLSKVQTINNTVQMLVIDYHLPTSSSIFKAASHSTLGMKGCNRAKYANIDRDDDSVVSSPSVAIIKPLCRRQDASLGASYIFCN